MKHLAATIFMIILSVTCVFGAGGPISSYDSFQIGSYPPIPQAMEFVAVLAQQPDQEGNFTIACRVLALLDDTKVALRINTSAGVSIQDRPRRLRGLTRLDKPYDFIIKCSRARIAERPVVNIELRYLFTYEAARSYIDQDPHGRYETTERKALAKRLLKSLEKSGRHIFTIDRAVLLD